MMHTLSRTRAYPGKVGHFQAEDRSDPGLEDIFRSLGRNAPRWAIEAESAAPRLLRVANEIRRVDPISAAISAEIVALHRQSEDAPPPRGRLWRAWARVRAAWRVLTA